MARRTAAVLILGLTLALVGAGLLFLRDGSGSDDESLNAFSNRGRPIEMAVPERVGAPTSPRLTGRAILIAEREGLRFLRLPRVDGSSCWASADRRSDLWQLTDYVCDVGLGRFPHAGRPVIVVGRVGPLPDVPLVVYHSFQGFAADGVERVAIIDAQDRVVPVAPVVGNVFYAATPPGRAKAVAALDEAGEVIWRGAGVQLPDE
jgi:hypothetical protein